MDSSALLFVALAVAWAVYLVPKALKHHDEAVRSRSVDRFSHRMRVLARREPVDRRNARLVVSPVRPHGRPPVETKARTSPAPASAAAASPSRAVTTAVSTVSRTSTRTAARRAARRRHRVLAVLLLVNAVVAGLAAAAVVAWPWTAAPAGLLVAWLVACRLSVRAELRARTTDRVHSGPRPNGTVHDVAGGVASASASPVVPTHSAEAADSRAADPPAVLTGEIPVVAVAGGWDMVPTTLPTYVTKQTAQRRTVSTIDLDSTGVWSSGRHEGDSALARSAEQADQAQKSVRDDAAARRASGA